MGYRNYGSCSCGSYDLVLTVPLFFDFSTASSMTSPGHAQYSFSRWSTSRLNSGTNSSNTSPCGSARSSFNYRQPYLGWRSQEKLSKPRTPAERLAAGLLPQRTQVRTRARPAPFRRYPANRLGVAAATAAPSRTPLFQIPNQQHPRALSTSVGRVGLQTIWPADPSRVESANVKDSTRRDATRHGAAFRRPVPYTDVEFRGSPEFARRARARPILTSYVSLVAGRQPAVVAQLDRSAFLHKGSDLGDRALRFGHARHRRQIIAQSRMLRGRRRLLQVRIRMRMRIANPLSAAFALATPPGLRPQLACLARTRLFVAPGGPTARPYIRYGQPTWLSRVIIVGRGSRSDEVGGAGGRRNDGLPRPSASVARCL